MNTQTQKMLSVLVIGACGRMGQMIRQVVQSTENVCVAGLLEHTQHPEIGKAQLPENMVLESHFLSAAQGCNIAISFALPEGLQDHLQGALAANIPLVIGSTGLDHDHQNALQRAGEKIPVLWAPNMSVGVALMRKLVREAAKNLPAVIGNEGFDIEVIESHHRFKLDSPSGTAIALGQAAAEGRGIDHDLCALYARPRKGNVRDAEAIGYASLRGGGIIGDHEVQFTSSNEQISLSHRALSRELFAASAVNAAQWLIKQTSGLYGIDDLIR